jgi:transcription initiation factor TFIID subunit TAF12
MPLLTMNLTRQSQLVYNQIQQTQTQTQAQTQTQTQSIFRLGSSINRNMIPLLITGNKSCKTCGGK